MLHQIRQWQRDERRLQEYLGEIRGTGCAEVRVASVESLTDQLLPQVLVAFRERFPQVRFRLMTGMTDTILEQVVTGDADIGICINPPITPRVRFIEQVGLEFGAVLAPSHPLAERQALWLRECLAYPALLPSPEMFHGSTLQQVLAKADLELEPVAAGNRILTLKSLARAGLGIAFLNRLDISRELAHGELVFKPLFDRHIAKAQLTLCAHSDRALPMATSVLAERLREAMLSIEPGQHRLA
ncbi:LysR substrate-binding domain-containing protein [Halomonas sp. A29]|uniref:LysR substrate-binding domain-containing protein n=1 Tax=Halomonas sp. A29 TaxID=3102786 RepID=UPI00398AE21E